jgi:cyclopropane fatty-acyl-phospholipid synthase-like methyltransferase
MNKILKTNTKTYDALAKEYEERVSVRRDFNDARISRFIKFVTTGKEILDIGCAVGLETRIFGEKGFTVTGIELSHEMAEYARQRNPHAEIIEGNFMKTGFEKKFDGIFAQAFIHLFPKEEMETVFKKLNDLLKADGVMYLTTSRSQESKEGWYEKLDYAGHYKRYRKFWTKEELEESLHAHGFQIVDYYEIVDPFEKCWMVFTVQK